MIISIIPEGGISPDEKRKIDEELKKKGVKKTVQELTSNLPVLLPESKNARKFINDIELSSTL